MKNLIEIAVSDGNFDRVEAELLHKIAKKNGISSSKLKDIEKNPGEVLFEVPEDDFEKFHQMYDLVHMMIVDNEVHEEEMKLCNIYASKFGYPKPHIDELIKTLKANIENGNDAKDTMARVKWMLN
ncbi:hypothetical protein [Fulvivirga lutimaris]|uniref:hypothetical protein n=1 Tax=Fulvivirga lutimaris TaxID=1819566 RepID=UPI0012BB7837|nr:hypothetical protein [Fulvivirga lutimaris]MTI38037.1 hypothetical protein [Fulvivirga lutimaris]